MSTQLAAIVGPQPPETNSLITIQKTKVKDQKLYCEFTEQADEESPARAFTMQGTELIHPDLQHCLAQLVPHLCLLTEQLAETPDYWPADDEELPARFASFTVTGFTMGRQQEGVTLTGQRQLKGSKVLNLNAPYVTFEDETEAAYHYAGRLETAVYAAITEAEAALRGKASDAGRQLHIFENPHEHLPTGE